MCGARTVIGKCVTLLSPDQKILDKVVRERLNELRTFGQKLRIALVGNRESAIVHFRYSVQRELFKHTGVLT